MFKLIQLYKKAFAGLSTHTWMLALVMLLNRTGAMVVPFLGIYTIKELGFTPTQAGMVLSAFGVGSVAGNYLGGILTDRFGSYRTQLTSLLLTAPIFLLIPLFKELPALCVCVFSLSLSAELFRPANSIAITRYAKKENVTRAFTLNRLALNLGFSFGPALGGFLSLYSFQWLFYGNAIGCLMTALVYYFYFSKHKPRNPKETIEEQNQQDTSMWNDYPFLIFCVINILYALVFSQLLSILPVFYKSHIGMSEFEIGTLLAYSGIFIVIFEMLIIYYTEHKFSLFKNMGFGLVFLFLTYMTLIINESLWGLYLSMTLLCISEILYMPYSTTYTVQAAGIRNKGKYMGMQGMTFSLALIITPIAATFIIERSNFTVLWICNLGVMLIACILMYILRKKEDKRQENFKIQ